MRVFDNSTSESKYMPWELKEIGFKHFMGVAGTYIFDNCYSLAPVTEFAVAAFVLNGSYQTYNLLANSVKSFDLHSDGKQITF